MNAKSSQRTLLKQAEEEFGLNSNVSTSVITKAVLDRKSAIELTVLEELIKGMEAEKDDLEVYLGFQTDPVALEDSLVLDIKKVFIEHLVNSQTLLSVVYTKQWDVDASGWLDVAEIKLNTSKTDDIQVVGLDFGKCNRYRGFVRFWSLDFT